MERHGNLNGVYVQAEDTRQSLSCGVAASIEPETRDPDLDLCFLYSSIVPSLLLEVGGACPNSTSDSVPNQSIWECASEKEQAVSSKELKLYRCSTF
jgi:hypothetical protein